MSVRRTKIIRDLLANKSRSLLIILAVAIGVAAFGLMITGRIVLHDNLRDGYAAANPAHAMLSLSSFDDDLLKFVQSMDTVSAAQAERVDQARILSAPDTWLSFEIHSLPNSVLINKQTLEEITVSPPPLYSIFLERSLKNVMQVGDSIQIQLLNGDVHSLRVAGFVNDLSRLPAEISLTGQGYISNPAETADLLGLDHEYNQLMVIFANAHTRSDVEIQTTQLVKTLEEEGYQVFSAQVPVPNKYALGDNMLSVLFILNALGVLTLILSAFLVTSVMSAVMSQQIPQIGILKSLGAHINQTMSLYFQEVLLFGLFALLLAVPMGLVGAYFLADGVATGMNFNVDHFSLPVITLLLQAGSALLVPLLASLVPILGGSTITIREAISNYKPERASSASRSLGNLPQLANLSVRNTFRRKGRLMLTFVALLLAGSMFIAIIGIRQSMRDALREMQGDMNYDVGIDFVRPYSRDKIEAEALNIDGVVAAETWAVDNGRLVFNNDHLSGSILLFGVPQGTVMARPGIIHGEWLSSGVTRGIFVNADFMDLSPSLKVGSVIKLKIADREEDWTILGSGGRGFIPVAYVFYDDLASQTGLNGLANHLVVQTSQPDSIFQSNMQSELLTRYDAVNFDVLGSQTTTQVKETNAAQMDILIILLLAMVILISVVGGLGLAITMSLNVIERTREIGILRSLGAQNGVVRRVVIVEGLVIGLISWALAIPCSIPLAVWLGNSLGNSLLARPLDYIFSIPAVLTWLGLMLIISVIASIIPAQSAAKLTIRDALVYE